MSVTAMTCNICVHWPGARLRCTWQYVPVFGCAPMVLESAFKSFQVCHYADLAFFFFFFPSSSPTSRVHHGPRPIFSFLFSVLFLLIGLLFLFFSFLFSFSAFCFLLSAFCFTFYFLLFTFFSFLFTFFSFTFCLTVLLSVFFFTLLLLYCFGFGVSYQIP